MLLALDSADPPAGHDGMYPRGALLAANYSVPILWLSLFDADGLVTWPGIHGDSTCTAEVAPAWTRTPWWPCRPACDPALPGRLVPCCIPGSRRQPFAVGQGCCRPSPVRPGPCRQAFVPR